MALICDRIVPVEDVRGQQDLYGRPLEVTRKAVADNLVSAAEEPVAPCGICRQSLIEFGDDVKVVMANRKGDAKIATVDELLPRGFTRDCIL